MSRRPRRPQRTHRPAKVFVGRRRELDLLDQALEDAVALGPQLVLVEGMHGAGKTALVEQWRRGAGVRVVSATASADEHELAFGVLDQWLRDGTASAHDLDPLQAGERLLALLEPLGQAAVVLDDAQWADGESVRALDYAFRRLGGQPVLVVILARPGESAELPESLRRPGVLQLEPLTAAELGELAISFARSLNPYELGLLHDRSQGIPLYARALLAELPALDESAVPSSIRALADGRLRMTTIATRQAVEALAVLGPVAPLRDLTRLVAGADIHRALEDASRAELVTFDNQHAAFVHPLLRDAVLDVTPPGRRVALHSAAAELAGKDALLHRAAATAGPDEELAAALEHAAPEAGRRGEWRRAASCLLAAAELSVSTTERDRRRLHAITMLIVSGDPQPGRTLAHDVAVAAEGCRRSLALAHLALADNELARAETLLEAAWDAVDDDALATEVALLRAWVSGRRLRPEAQVHWGRWAVELGDGVAAMLATSLVAAGVAFGGDVRAGLEQLDTELDRTPVELRDVAPATATRGWLRLLADDLPGARADLSAAVGSTAPARLAQARLAWLEFYAGRWEDALARAEHAIALGARAEDEVTVSLARAAAAHVLAARGEFEAAEENATAGVAASEAELALAELATAQVALTRGDAEGAMRVLASQPAPCPSLYADGLIATGRLAEAEALLAAAANPRSRASRARRLHASARLRIAQDRREDVSEMLETAAATFQELGYPYERALAELTHGGFLRRIGRRRDATRLLLVARATLRELGAEPALERCERELGASGMRSPDADGEDASGLTAQERSVAQLIVDGHSNREIASELMVSVKTVEAHITRVYAKLGVRSRSQLRLRARTGELRLG